MPYKTLATTIDNAPVRPQQRSKIIPYRNDELQEAQSLVNGGV